MENYLMVNGEKIELSEDELEKLGIKFCDICGKRLSDKATKRNLLVQAQYRLEINDPTYKHMEYHDYYICDECLEKATNIKTAYGGKIPLFIHNEEV